MKSLYARLASTGMQIFLISQGFLIFIPLKTKSWTAALICVPLIGLVSFVAWLSALKRRHAVTSIPASKIGSAAQGHVQLAGCGKPMLGMPLISPLTRTLCLWYKVDVFEQPGAVGTLLAALARIFRHFFAGNEANAALTPEESLLPFIISDDTGRCTLLDIGSAEKLCSNETTRRTANKIITEWCFNLNEPLYVLGDFKTVDGHTLEFDARAEVSNLLAEWKKDPVSLNKRFDLDGNNQLNEKEWNLARSAARRAVEKERDESLSQPAAHFIHSPASGEVYLISNISPAKLAFRYLLWSVFHLLVFMGAMGSIPWIIGHL